MHHRYLKKYGISLLHVLAFVLWPCQSALVSANDLLRLQDPGLASYRAPVDVVWMDGVLFTANSKTGTISLIETSSLRCISEWQLSKSLSALERCGDHLLALDDSSHQLLVLKFLKDSAALKIVDRLSVPRYPVDLAVSAGCGPACWLFFVPCRMGNSPSRIERRYPLPRDDYCFRIPRRWWLLITLVVSYASSG